MINIFGLRIVTGKDWDELKQEVKTIADDQRELNKNFIGVKFDHYKTDASVKNFMDFVMRRMPLKRHRKEAREYFPPHVNMPE